MLIEILRLTREPGIVHDRPGRPSPGSYGRGGFLFPVHTILGGSDEAEDMRSI